MKKRGFGVRVHTEKDCSTNYRPIKIKDENIACFIVNHADSIPNCTAEQKTILSSIKSIDIPGVNFSLTDSYTIKYDERNRGNNGNMFALINRVMESLSSHTLTEHKCLDVVAAIMSEETGIQVKYFKKADTHSYLLIDGDYLDISRSGKTNKLFILNNYIEAFRTCFGGYFTELGLTDYTCGFHIIED